MSNTETILKHLSDIEKHLGVLNREKRILDRALHYAVYDTVKDINPCEKILKEAYDFFYKQAKDEVK